MNQSISSEVCEACEGLIRKEGSNAHLSVTTFSILLSRVHKELEWPSHFLGQPKRSCANAMRQLMSWNKVIRGTNVGLNNARNYGPFITRHRAMPGPEDRPVWEHRDKEAT